MEDNKSQPRDSFSIATGKDRMATVWKNTRISWEEFRQRLANPVITRETALEYSAMSRDDQTRIKDVGGFVAGYLKDGRRNVSSVVNRSMVVLDYDDFDAAHLDEVRRKLRCRWLMHSTHKHTDRAWRVRLVVPCDRDMTPDEFGAVSRRVAEQCGFSGIDKSTFEPCRLMFWSSRSSDAPYLFEESAHSRLLEVDRFLASYQDWRDISEWPQLPEETEFLDKVEKHREGRTGNQADPLQKKGIVGVFCRTYSISDAIDTFLNNVYVKARTRNHYTYTAGSTVGGALILDEGRFIYSYHSTDPCAGKLLNAFDLVRLHMFGNLDAKAARDTRTQRLPSFKAMEEFALEDSEVRRTLMDERRAKAIADMKDFYINDDESSTIGSGQPGSNSEQLTPEQKEWDEIRVSLPFDKNGNLRTSAEAIVKILTYEPALRGRLRYNEFSGDIEGVGRFPWKRTEDQWTDRDDSNLRVWLDRMYGITGKEKIYDALEAVAVAQGYHPIKDYLESLTWDGVPRLGSLFVEVMGAEDTPLYRRLPEMIFTTACRRIYEPGAKFDYFIILTGPEGCGKSSLFSIMGGKWFSDSVNTIEGKEGMQSVQGSWIIEMPELTSTKRSETVAVKSFVSRQTDRYRAAYGRRTEEHPRQCVMVGTTNEDLFLRGIATGNRRSPVVEIKPELRKPLPPVRQWVSDFRDQLWAEAMMMHRRGDEIWLHDPKLEKDARETQERHNLDIQNPLFGEIDRFLDMWLPFEWDTMDSGQRQAWYDSHPDGGYEGLDYMQREYVTIPEILREGLGIKRDSREYLTKSREVGQYLKKRDKEWIKVGNRRSKVYGVQMSWKRVISESSITPLNEL